MGDYERAARRCRSRLASSVLTAGLSLAAALGNLPTGNAWGKEGHEIVGNIAYGRLSDGSREAVKSILGIDREKDGGDNKDDPLDSTPLAAVANWADKVRFTKAYAWSTGLHYIDIRDDEVAGGCPCTSAPVAAVHDLETLVAPSCWFVYERDCVDDFCAVGAISNYTNRLLTAHGRRRLDQQSLRGFRAESASRDDWPAREALMFLTHFVGDIHQPLHSSRTSDKGGNTIKVHFNHSSLTSRPVGGRDGILHEGWNLHSVWDVAIIDRAIAETYNKSQLAFQKSVLDLVKEAGQSGLVDVWLRCYDGRDHKCPSSWAEESFEDALRWAYSDEYGHEIVDGAALSDEYFYTRLHVVMRRLAAAGVRLAATLEAVLGDGRDGQNEEQALKGNAGTSSATRHTHAISPDTALRTGLFSVLSMN